MSTRRSTSCELTVAPSSQQGSRRGKVVDAPAPASFPMTSIGHGRKNATRACDMCKRTRTRCSGTLPCARCSEFSLTCQFNCSYRRGRPPSLQARSVDYRLSPTPSNPRDAQLQLSPRSSPERDLTDISGNYLGPSSGITFLKRAWARLNQDFVTNIPRQRDEPSLKTSIFNYGDIPFDVYKPNRFELPTRQKASSLVAIYFDKAVVTYRFLHKGTVESWLDEIYAADSSLLDDCPKSPSLISRAAVVLMVFAMVMLHEEKSQEWNTEAFDVAQSEHWFGAAEHMMSIQTGPRRLEMIQARMVQCLYLISSSRANQCLHTMGDVTYLLLAAGLHRKRQKPLVNISYIEQECQKRVFWSAYTLERYLSVMLGRPRMLHDEDIDQVYPEEINDEDMTPDGPAHNKGSKDCVIAASTLHFRLARIVGNMTREVYNILPITEGERLRVSEKLTLSLDDWKSQLPPIFGSVKEASLIVPFNRQSNILRTAYIHAVIHATRSFLLISYTDLRQQPTDSIENVLKHVRKCIEAAQTLVNMVNNLTDGKLSQAFWFSQYTSFCAVVVIYIYTIQQRHIFHHYPSMPSSSDLLASAEHCQRLLAEASKKHSPSQRYNIILEELRNEVHRQTAPPRQEEAEFPSSMDVGGSTPPLTAVFPGQTNGSLLSDGQIDSANSFQSDHIQVNQPDELASGLILSPDWNWNWNSTEWQQLDLMPFIQITDPVLEPLDFT